MSAKTKTRTVKLQRPGLRVCPSHAHDYLEPLRQRRPVVVFCTRCQTARTLA